jgi:Rps23 Pro-64 3,4-dihydroxylase Tpa1-like proline 4-hydroxylase
MKNSIIDKFKNSDMNDYPFPHFVLDNLIDPISLEEIFRELSILEKQDPTNLYKSEFGEKKEWKFFPENLKSLNSLLEYLSSQEFICILKSKFQIDNSIEIYPDATYDGGGYVISPPKSFLGYHADFNFSNKIGKYRVLNILIYMNQNYHESQGGKLHLLDSNSKTVEKMVEPLANRLLAFFTDDKSFHGVGMNQGKFYRRSFNLYYYSDLPISSEQSTEPHKTIWLDTDKHEH